MNPFTYMNDIKLFTKDWKTTRDYHANNKNIQPRYRMVYDIENVPCWQLKFGKEGNTEGIEVSNQERTRTLGEKGNWMYIQIMEVNTIDQVEPKKMILQKIQKTYNLFVLNFNTQYYISLWKKFKKQLDKICKCKFIMNPPGAVEYIDCIYVDIGVRLLQWEPWIWY